MQFALFATLHRPHAVTIIQQVSGWLLAHGHRVRMAPALATVSGFPQCAIPEKHLLREADLVMTVGGDGTMLGAVRLAAPHHVPVLGVNAGALGFLTELAPEQLDAQLPRVIAGDYTVESRMMLRAQCLRQQTCVADLVALNDLVVRQGTTGRLITLNVIVAGSHLGRFSADGLICSTPTGSTAYGLSAGGPIVHPLTSMILLVPICPHSLSFRPLVVPATDPIEILCESNQHGDDMMISADGQEPVTLQAQDRLIVQPAREHALLVKLGLFSFYDRLRDKLHWGGV